MHAKQVFLVLSGFKWFTFLLTNTKPGQNHCAFNSKQSLTLLTLHFIFVCKKHYFSIFHHIGVRLAITPTPSDYERAVSVKNILKNKKNSKQSIQNLVNVHFCYWNCGQSSKREHFPESQSTPQPAITRCLADVPSPYEAVRTRTSTFRHVQIHADKRVSSSASPSTLPTSSIPTPHLAAPLLHLHPPPTPTRAPFQSQHCVNLVLVWRSAFWAADRQIGFNPLSATDGAQLRRPCGRRMRAPTHKGESECMRTNTPSHKSGKITMHVHFVEASLLNQHKNGKIYTISQWLQSGWCNSCIYNVNLLMLGYKGEKKYIRKSE